MPVVNKNGALMMAIGADPSDLYRNLNQSEVRIDQFGNYVKKTGDKIGMALSAGFGGAILTNFAKEIINVRGEMQMLESSFEVLLGGKGVSGFMSEMKQFAVDSPLSMNGVANAAQTLLGFGITAEKVMPTIKQIGDISMGNEERFKSLSLAFAQMSATGKLMGQDLLQMINAGFNPLQTISEKTGKSIGELKKDMENGAISSEMVAKAFASATEKGGKFYGMTQKQAEGIRGLQAQLEGGLQEAFNEIGKSQEGLIAGGYRLATTLVENYRLIGEALTALIATYGVYKAAMGFNTSIDKTVTVMRYEAEIAELTKLLPLKEQEANADLKTAVASGKLTQAKAEQLIALRAEIQSKLEVIKANQATAISDLEAATASHKAALQRALASKAMVSQRQMELSLAKLGGDAAQIELAQKSLLQAQEERHIAVKARKASADTLAISRSQANAASVAVETMQTGINTATQNANTVSTNVLTAAKTRLITVTKNLWAALAPNPYVLAAAAAVALGYGIYKLATAATAAEQAQAALNKETERTAAKADEERAAIEKLLGVIKDDVSTRNEKQKALDTLQTKYPSIFKNLDIEKIKNLELVDAIRQVNIELEKRSGIESQANIDRAKEILKGVTDWDGVTFKTNKDIKDAKDLLGLDGVWERNSITNAKLKNDLEDYIRQAENKLLNDAVTASRANFNILPKDEKISVLKKDIDSLQAQYDRLKKLDEEQKKNSFSGGLSLYGSQLNAVEKQINEKNAQIKVIEKDTENTVIKNKAYWEKIRDDQQKVMDSNLPDSNIFETAKKQRDEAAKKLEQWNKTSFKSQESAAEKALKLAQKQADDQLKLNNDKARADLDARNIELDNQQSLLNIQEEGFDKQQKQTDLNHQKEILAIDKRVQELIEKKQDAERKEWDIKNPNGSKTPFAPKTKSVADLNYSDITGIIESDIIATKTREKAISDSLKATIEEYQSYVDKYSGINTKFNKKIADLEKARTPENKEQVDRSITEAKYEQDEALKAVNNEFAQREETFLSWTNQIADLSLKQLQNLLSQVEKELKAAESSRVSGADLAVARAKVDAAKEQIKNANTTTTPGKRTIKEWQDLEKTLHDVNDSFEEIGDSVGGTVGVILSAAGQIASSTLSMINGIITLANSASTATEQTAKAASASIQAVEKASVILAIISAALQIATKIASLFAADYSEYNKAKEAYESYISVLDKVIEKQKELVETMTGENARNSYEYALEFIKKQEAAARELGKQRLDSGASAGSHSIGVRIRKRMSQEGWNQASQVLGKDFGWATDGRMTGLFDLSIEQLKELQEKAPSFWAQLDGDVQNYLNSIIESEKAIEDMRKVLQESVTQVSFDSFRDSFLDTLLDMNSDAKDFAEDFEKYLQKSMLNSLLKEKFDDQIRALYNSFSKYGEDNINEAEYAALQKQKDDLVNDMIKERDKMKDLFDWTSDSDTSQSSSRGGFETITQDQAGSIDGRLTGMHETDLRIEQNTLQLILLASERNSVLKGYTEWFQAIRNVLVESMFLLQEIRDSNNELYEIREDIAYLRKNGIKIA